MLRHFPHYAAALLCAPLLISAPLQAASTPSNANTVKFLGANCTADDAKASNPDDLSALELSFTKFTLDYDPNLLGPHTAHCKVLVQTASKVTIKSLELALAKATGEGFKAQLGMAMFNGKNVFAAPPQDIDSTQLPAKVSLSLPDQDQPCQQASTIHELTFSLIAIENNERQLSSLAIDSISNIETTTCATDSSEDDSKKPSISLTGFGDGQKGPCTFLFDGGKLEHVSRNLPNDEIFFNFHTSGTKRGLLDYWDTIGSNTMACKFNIKAYKTSAFQMKFIKATLPVAESDTRNKPIAAKINVTQQRSAGDARKYVFTTADVAPQMVSVTEFALEGDEPEVTKCSNGHNYTVTLTFEVPEADHIQHLSVLNGPTLIAVHQPCGIDPVK